MQPFIEMIPPSLLLATLLAVLWGTLWFVWRGGRGRDWLVDVLVSVVAFAAGQFAGRLLEWSLPMVGEVRVVEGTLASWLALWLLRRGRRT